MIVAFSRRDWLCSSIASRSLPVMAKKVVSGSGEGSHTIEPSVMPLAGDRPRDAILSSVQHPDQVGSAVRRDAPRVPSQKSAPWGAFRFYWACCKR